MRQEEEEGDPSDARICLTRIRLKRIRNRIIRDRIIIRIRTRVGERGYAVLITVILITEVAVFIRCNCIKLAGETNVTHPAFLVGWRFVGF